MFYNLALERISSLGVSFRLVIIPGRQVALVLSVLVSTPEESVTSKERGVFLSHGPRWADQVTGRFPLGLYRPHRPEGRYLSLQTTILFLARHRPRPVGNGEKMRSRATEEPLFFGQGDGFLVGLSPTSFRIAFL